MLGQTKRILWRYNCIVLLLLWSHLQCMCTNPGIAKDFLDQDRRKFCGSIRNLHSGICWRVWPVDLFSKDREVDLKRKELWSLNIRIKLFGVELCRSGSGYQSGVSFYRWQRDKCHVLKLRVSWLEWFFSNIWVIFPATIRARDISLFVETVQFSMRLPGFRPVWSNRKNSTSPFGSKWGRGFLLGVFPRLCCCTWFCTFIIQTAFQSETWFSDSGDRLTSTLSTNIKKCLALPCEIMGLLQIDEWKEMAWRLKFVWDKMIELFCFKHHGPKTGFPHTAPTSFDQRRIESKF